MCVCVCVCVCVSIFKDFMGGTKSNNSPKESYFILFKILKSKSRPVSIPADYNLYRG